MTQVVRRRLRPAGEARPAVRRSALWRVETARLVIRAWRTEDAAAWEAAIEASREHLRPWLPWASAPSLGHEARRARIETSREQLACGRDASLGVFGRDGRQLLGGAGVHRTLGLDGRTLSYWLAAGHVGHGYATEAAAALTRVAFEHDGVGRVEIHVDAENRRSAAVPDRLGFRLVATRRQLLNLGVPDLVERPVRVYRLTQATYPRSVVAATPVAAFDAGGARVL